MKPIADISLDGGVLCLDFVNTVSSRTSPNFQDYLYDFSHVILWCRRLELINDKELLIWSESISDADKNGIVLKKYISVRENLYKIFSAIAGGKEPDEKHIDHFSKNLSEALSKLRFHFKDDSYHLVLQKGKESLYEPLNSILKSAFDLLSKDQKDRIKVCGECGWLFFDISKNNTRQWCNPSNCGTVTRSRRYQQKKKAKKG